MFRFALFSVFCTTLSLAGAVYLFARLTPADAAPFVEMLGPPGRVIDLLRTQEPEESGGDSDAVPDVLIRLQSEREREIEQAKRQISAQAQEFLVDCIRFQEHRQLFHVNLVAGVFTAFAPGGVGRIADLIIPRSRHHVIDSVHDLQQQGRVYLNAREQYKLKVREINSKYANDVRFILEDQIDEDFDGRNDLSIQLPDGPVPARAFLGAVDQVAREIAQMPPIAP